MDTIFWFRRDLRLDDNTGLYHALQQNDSVLPIFIFDSNILEKLEDKDDRRVNYIHDQLTQLKEQLEELGSSLKIFHATPEEAFQHLIQSYSLSSVYTNHDYEPYARERDQSIAALLKENNISFHTFKDQVIFEKDDILKDNGEPYSVYTPYSRKWKAKVTDDAFKSWDIKAHISNFKKVSPYSVPTLEELGFTQCPSPVEAPKWNTALVQNYHETRDIPSIKGTTRVSTQLRFGTISIRKLAKKAQQLNEKYLNELIWREFYMMILWHYPHTNKAFKAKYDKIPWSNNEVHFEKWCKGETGIPIVDAGMRELNATGHMHNRVRMIVASFLTKNLLIDWRWGEAYFARKLNDFELASNNGGWQWASGSGCDAAPYFRVFNPESQAKKFDPDLKYIRKWVPEIDDPFTYPKPIVDLKETRAHAIAVYKEALAVS